MEWAVSKGMRSFNDQLQYKRMLDGCEKHIAADNYLIRPSNTVLHRWFRGFIKNMNMAVKGKVYGCDCSDEDGFSIGSWEGAACVGGFGKIADVRAFLGGLTKIEKSAEYVGTRRLDIRWECCPDGDMFFEENLTYKHPKFAEYKCSITNHPPQVYDKCKSKYA